jgi:hypothetical protein
MQAGKRGRLIVSRPRPFIPSDNLASHVSDRTLSAVPMEVIPPGGVLGVEWVGVFTRRCLT